jgi:hypothetical protein
MALLTTEITYKGKGNPTSTGDADVFIKPVLATPELASLGIDIRENVVTKEALYKIIPSDKLTKKKIGCGWNPSGNLGELLDEEISVTELAVELEQCAKDFDGTILQTMKNQGVTRNDLTNGTVLQDILVGLAKPIIASDLIRIFLLGDTASASEDYNQIDGIWKKLFAAVAGGKVTRVGTAIADTGMVYNDANKEAALAILNALHFDASYELQAIPETEKLKVVTQSIYNNYMQFLMNNRALESSWVQIQEGGPKFVSHLGVPVVPISFVDRYLKADFAPGGDVTSPHRAWYAAKNNLVLATDLASDFTTIDFWYEKKPQMNYMRVEYKLGAAIAWPELVAVAY